MATEADTCRKYVVPKLIEARWDDGPHSIAEQRTFTDGRIVVTGKKIRRKKKKRADYLLRYTRDFTLAVVEAKARENPPVQVFSRQKNMLRSSVSNLLTPPMTFSI